VVVGPPSATPIPIFVQGSAEVSSGADGRAEAYFAYQAGLTIDLVSSSAGLSLTINGLPTPVADGLYNFNMSVPSYPGTPYDVTMEVNSGVLNAGSASAFLDPYFYIDPTFAFASEYSVIVSAGIGNTPPGSVPEPSTWAMLLIGFAGLGYAEYARRRARPLSAS
jgi:hypothetical protein